MTIRLGPQLLYLLTILTTSLWACGEHDAHHGRHEIDEIAEGCQHIDDVESIMIDTAEDSGELVVHARFALTLSEQDDRGFMGSVGYTSPGGQHYLFMRQAAQVTILDSTGETVTPENVLNNGMVESCEDAVVMVQVVLPPGEYAFVFTDATDKIIEVTLHVAGASHDHGDHAH